MVHSTEIFAQRFQKSILIFLFLFLAIALILAWSAPATGYESSIYMSTPQVLWVALLLGEVAGISIVVLSLSKTQSSAENFWKYGLLLINLGYLVLLSIFILRGYYMVDISGDVGSHMGWINEILQTGYTSSSLFYPLLHIYTSEIVRVTTLSPIFLYKFFRFFVLYFRLFLPFFSSAP